jgi:hypothetical protein
LKFISTLVDTTDINGPCLSGYSGGVLGVQQSSFTSIIRWSASAITLNAATTVNSTLTSTSSITATSFNASSDRRLKTEFQPVAPQWENIKYLQPSQYKWKSNHRLDHGFVAQDVYKTYPDMWSGFADLNTQESTFENPIDYSGNPLFYTLDYSKMTPYLWKGLQEAIHQIEHQQTQINELQSQVNTIMRSLHSLKL